MVCMHVKREAIPGRSREIVEIDYTKALPFNFQFAKYVRPLR